MKTTNDKLTTIECSKVRTALLNLKMYKSTLEYYIQAMTPHYFGGDGYSKKELNDIFNRRLQNNDNIQLIRHFTTVKLILNNEPINLYK